MASKELDLFAPGVLPASLSQKTLHTLTHHGDSEVLMLILAQLALVAKALTVPAAPGQTGNPIDAVPVDVMTGRNGGRHVTGGDDAIDGPFSALQFLEDGVPHGDMEGNGVDPSPSNVVGISGNSFPAGTILYGRFQIAKLDSGRCIAYYV